jgi:ribosome-binding protein aMBF1 (putative translation factor)
LVKTSRHLEEERSLFLFVLGLIEDLPKVLSQKRISLGMTQKELAEKLGIKEQMYSVMNPMATNPLATIA